jgi:hypothetical protein
MALVPVGKLLQGGKCVLIAILIEQRLAL